MRYKEKHRADWDALIKEFGDHEDDCTDAESSQRAPELKLLDDWEQIRQKFALTPAGLNPARNIAMINGRPVVILVLTHEAETLSAKMPYMSAACEGCPVFLMWGRCARKEPTCTPATSIFWWFMDREGLITSLLSTYTSGVMFMLVKCLLNQPRVESDRRGEWPYHNPLHEPLKC